MGGGDACVARHSLLMAQFVGNREKAVDASVPSPTDDATLEAVP